jgi:hypothetical protein
MKHEGRDDGKIMHGSTFYGPNDRWEDYQESKIKKEPVAPGAGDMFHSEAEREAFYGSPIKLPGEA